MDIIFLELQSYINESSAQVLSNKVTIFEFSGRNTEYEYKYDFGTKKYHIILDAGISLSADGKADSFLTYESKAPISLNQNLVWPNVDAVKEYYSEDNLAVVKPTRPAVTKTPINNFCNATSPEQPDMGINEVSGGYRFDASDKKITFELRLNTSRSKEGYSSPIQKILLGFSEDDTWGNDFIISCDTHRHMSAFGQWKVVVFHNFNFTSSKKWK